jgi:hypothetical protein
MQPKNFLFQFAAPILAATLLTAAMPMGGGKLVTVKNNGKEIKALSGEMNVKPGAYNQDKKAEIKRQDLGKWVIGIPSDNLDAGDSVKIDLTGFSGASAIWKESLKGVAGDDVEIDLTEVASKDFTPNGNKPTLIAKISINVAPMKRAALKGIYQGTLLVK